MIRRPLGFGDVEQVAEFFNLTKKVVRHKALTGEWPSYVVDGQRIFNLDGLVDQLIHSEARVDQSKERPNEQTKQRPRRVRPAR